MMYFLKTRGLNSNDALYLPFKYEYEYDYYNSVKSFKEKIQHW